MAGLRPWQPTERCSAVCSPCSCLPASPARRRLLEQAGIPHQVRVSMRPDPACGARRAGEIAGSGQGHSCRAGWLGCEVLGVGQPKRSSVGTDGWRLPPGRAIASVADNLRAMACCGGALHQPGRDRGLCGQWINACQGPRRPLHRNHGAIGLSLLGAGDPHAWTSSFVTASRNQLSAPAAAGRAFPKTRNRDREVPARAIPTAWPSHGSPHCLQCCLGPPFQQHGRATGPSGAHTPPAAQAAWPP